MNRNKNIKYTFVNATAVGSTIVVPGMSNYKIRLLGAVIISSAAVNISFISGVTPITASAPIGINGGFTLPYSDAGWCETVNPNEDLSINLSTSTPTGATIVYQYFS